MNAELVGIIYFILSKLIQFESVTPDDAGTQQYIGKVLEDAGFMVIHYDNPPVNNMLAIIGEGEPFLLFAGHTDVVPAGNIDSWQSNPFTLTSDGTHYYGRGVADMKGSLAAMIAAVTYFAKDYKPGSGRIGLLLTSSEEGAFYNQGTPYALQQMIKQNLKPNYCIVGEPSSTTLLGDVIKNGRRGSLNVTLTVHGRQGHVAYPHLAINPLHIASNIMHDLLAEPWDKGNKFFAPTSLQFTNINSGVGVHNVIPEDLQVKFNFRYSTETTAADLEARVNAVVHKYAENVTLDFERSGNPFLTEPGVLTNSVIQAIKQYTGNVAELSTDGGTSDARFIAPYGIEVIEFGPVNATIHKVNETVKIDDLTNLARIYYAVCQEVVK